MLFLVLLFHIIIIVFQDLKDKLNLWETANEFEKEYFFGSTRCRQFDKNGLRVEYRSYIPLKKKHPFKKICPDIGL